MLSIGEFANITGLSVKALRHYDEKAVLVPADVDPCNGYRRYSEAQVRSGIIVQVMRNAGVPLPVVGAALRNHDAEQVLEQHRNRVELERIREDAGFDNANRVLTALKGAVQVEERSSSAQPYVARVITVSAETEGDIDDEAANEQFAELFSELQSDGYGPSGNFWTGLRQKPEIGQAELHLCWPTAKRVPEGWGGEGTISAELPRRRELVAKWLATGHGSLPEGSVHPAVVALFETIADDDVQVDSSEIRQSMQILDEDRYSIEVAVTMDDVT